MIAISAMKDAFEGRLMDDARRLLVRQAAMGSVDRARSAAPIRQPANLIGQPSPRMCPLPGRGLPFLAQAYRY